MKRSAVTGTNATRGLASVAPSGFPHVSTSPSCRFPSTACFYLPSRAIFWHHQISISSLSVMTSADEITLQWLRTMIEWWYSIVAITSLMFYEWVLTWCKLQNQFQSDWLGWPNLPLVKIVYPHRCFTLAWLIVSWAWHNIGYHTLKSVRVRNPSSVFGHLCFFALKWLHQQMCRLAVPTLIQC
jgi:hypothetical protein